MKCSGHMTSRLMYTNCLLSELSDCGRLLYERCKKCSKNKHINSINIAEKASTVSTAVHTAVQRSAVMGSIQLQISHNGNTAVGHTR